MAVAGVLIALGVAPLVLIPLLWVGAARANGTRTRANRHWGRGVGGAAGGGDGYGGDDGGGCD